MIIINDFKSNKDPGILDELENGGKLDAFRHVFTMSLLTQKIKSKKIRKLGIAHEKGNYLQFKNGKFEDGELPDSVGTEMDLRNNEIGIKLGSENKKLNSDSIIQLVLLEIKNGNCWVVRMYPHKNVRIYYTCDGHRIPSEDLKGKWRNSKCLVKSNYNSVKHN
ncbi:MAG: hypothetical protein IAF38_20810 [Bacteroidia bacterium]|nr:hypothetical protein [Bacteroidia bacterium]